MDATECLAGLRLMPVLALSEETSALRLAHVLRDVGFRALEITLRTPQALSILQSLARAMPELTWAPGAFALSKSPRPRPPAHNFCGPGHTETYSLRCTASRLSSPAPPPVRSAPPFGSRPPASKFFQRTLGGAPALQSWCAPTGGSLLPTGGTNSARLPPGPRSRRHGRRVLVRSRSGAASGDDDSTAAAAEPGAWLMAERLELIGMWGAPMPALP